MKTLKSTTLGLILALGSLTGLTQQAPMYTHYMYNTLSVNPAYAGSREALSITGLHRSQWIDFTGAPITQTITAHSPVINENIGMGISLLNDKIGPTNNSAAFFSFAYKIKLNEKSKLSFGLSAGVNMFRANLNDLQLDEQVDPTFQTNVSNHITPNFGFGAYYSRERFYAGISAPNLLQNNYSVVNVVGGNTLVAKEQRHYFLIAGALFNLTNQLAFKPTTLIKVTSGAPIQADFTASFIIKQKLLLGAMFRTGDAVGALVGFDITQQLHIGYSFDWSYGVRTFRYNQGSHELMLRYDFIYSSRKQISTPRYF